MKLIAKHGDAGVLSQGSGCYTMAATGTDYRPNVITFQVVSAPSCPGCSISEPEIDNTVTKWDFYTRWSASLVHKNGTWGWSFFLLLAPRCKQHSQPPIFHMLCPNTKCLCCWAYMCIASYYYDAYFLTFWILWLCENYFSCVFCALFTAHIDRTIISPIASSTKFSAVHLVFTIKYMR